MSTDGSRSTRGAFSLLVASPGVVLYALGGAASVAVAFAALLQGYVVLFSLALGTFGPEAVLGSTFSYGLGLTVLAAYGVFSLIAIYAVWLPFTAAVAHSVGRTHRGEPPSRLATVRVVLERRRLLLRWAVFKALATGFTARFFGRLATAVRRRIAGDACEHADWRRLVGYVTPAIALESPANVDEAFTAARERASTAPREPSYFLMGAVGTTLLALGTWTGMLVFGRGLEESTILAAALYATAACLVLGFAVTAACELAVRTRNFVDADSS